MEVCKYISIIDSFFWHYFTLLKNKTIHNKFEDKIIAIEAEIALEKSISKADFATLMGNIDNLLELMNSK
jgi:hypothetical protein